MNSRVIVVFSKKGIA